MINGLSRAVALIEEAIDNSVDIIHTQSLEYAKELIEKEIDSLPNCEKCSHFLYKGNSHDKSWCGYNEVSTQKDLVCCHYEEYIKQ